MKKTTIDVSYDTKKELNKIKGNLMRESGRNATYDDAIKFLLKRLTSIAEKGRTALSTSGTTANSGSYA